MVRPVFSDQDRKLADVALRILKIEPNDETTRYALWAVAACPTFNRAVRAMAEHFGVQPASWWRTFWIRRRDL
jgi:hypothetical protein